MQMRIDARGGIACLYSEVIDLAAFGLLSIQRASLVEPDAKGGWWADLMPVRGPKLGPFQRRSEALQAEECWLEEHRLSG